MARLALSRPDLAKISPINRIRTSVGPHRNAMLAAPPFFNPWQRDTQFAGAERGIGARHVERAGEPNRPRESPKYPFRNMEGRLAMMRAGGRPLYAGDHQCVARDHHA